MAGLDSSCPPYWKRLNPFPRAGKSKFRAENLAITEEIRHQYQECHDPQQLHFDYKLSKDRNPVWGKCFVCGMFALGWLASGVAD